MPTGIEHYDVITSSRAESDLDEIYRYIARDSLQNAATFIARLIEAINSLEIFPHRYRIYQGRRRLSTAVRRMPVPPYLIYYTVDDKGRRVEIVTVRHGARRQPRNILRS